MPRRGPLSVVLAALVAALLAVGLAPAALAGTDTGAESAFLGLLNQRRAEVGLPALTVAPDLVDVARRHSVRMADGQDLHHNPNVTSEVSGWQKVGENVGRGPAVDAVHAAFVSSPSHDANLVEPDWSEVGIGVEERDGRLWVTQVFRQPAAPTTEVAGVATEAPAEPAAPAPAEPAPAAPAAPAPVVEPAAAEPAPAVAEAAPRSDRTTVMLARTEAIDGPDLAQVLGEDW